MFQKPKGFDRVGVIQCFLALFFVLWFFIFPSLGIYFAWPVKPELTALFLGSGFLLRSYYGYHIWREKDWYKLRWLAHGDYAFLGVLFVTTWWHIAEMNWHLTTDGEAVRIFTLIMAHVWTLAYTFEPVTVYLLEPRGKDKEAAEVPVPAELSEGPILPFTKKTLLAVFYLSTVIFALLFFDTNFADSRWPWALNPFDSRIMSAFPAGVGVWAITMYFMKDWAEVKIGFTGIVLFFSALFLMSIVTMVVSPWWVPGEKNIPTFPIGTGIFAALLLYSYWKQHTARPKK
jgi:hypothetical protein